MFALEKKIKLQKWCLTIILYILMLRFLFPVIRKIGAFDNLFKLLNVPILILVFLLVGLTEKYIVNQWKFIGLLWISYLVLVAVVTKESSTISRIFLDLHLFVFMLLIEWLIAGKMLKEINKMMWLSIIFISLTICYSLYMLTIDPVLARNSASTVDVELVKGIADFSYIYALIAFTPVLVLRIKEFLKLRQNLNAYIFIAFLILEGVYFLKSQYIIAFLLFLFGIFYALIEGMHYRKIIWFYAFIFIAFAVLIVFLNLYDILKMVYEYIPPSMYNYRGKILDFMKFLEGENIQNLEGMERFVKLFSTVQAFLKYPYGAVWKGAAFHGNRMGVDFHTEWFNVLAFYGVQGLVINLGWYFCFFWKIAGYVKNNLSMVKESRYVKHIFVMIFLTGLLDPIHFVQSYYFIVAFVGICLCLGNRDKRKKKYEDFNG